MLRLEGGDQFLFVVNGGWEFRGATADVADDVRIAAAYAEVAELIRHALRYGIFIAAVLASAGMSTSQIFVVNAATYVFFIKSNACWSAGVTPNTST